MSPDIIDVLFYLLVVGLSLSCKGFRIDCLGKFSDIWEDILSCYIIVFPQGGQKRKHIMFVVMVTISELVDVFVENKFLLYLALIGGDCMASGLLEYFGLFGEVFARCIVSRCIVHKCSETRSEIVHLVGRCFYAKLAHFIGFIKFIKQKVKSW